VVVGEGSVVVEGGLVALVSGSVVVAAVIAVVEGGAATDVDGPEPVVHAWPMATRLTAAIRHRFTVIKLPAVRNYGVWSGRVADGDPNLVRTTHVGRAARAIG
jgi:hypothetical protein